MYFKLPAHDTKECDISGARYDTFSIKNKHLAPPQRCINMGETSILTRSLLPFYYVKTIFGISPDLGSVSIFFIYHG